MLNALYRTLFLNKLASEPHCQQRNLIDSTEIYSPTEFRLIAEEFIREFELDYIGNLFRFIYNCFNKNHVPGRSIRRKPFDKKNAVISLLAVLLTNKFVKKKLTLLTSAF